MIELDAITVRIGEFCLPEVSMKIETGTYAILMGKTGVGKTTLLEAICGLRKVEKGQVRIADIDVTSWSPGDRQLGYVPQDLALFPTLTVEQQIRFPMKLRKLPNEQQSQRIEELSGLLGIGYLMKRKIQGLSGGEAQRIALARALSFRPTALLLDEPLSALDSGTRDKAQEMLKEINQSTGVTVLHVTHNEQEAELLADQCLRLTHDREAQQVSLESQGRSGCS